MIPNAVYPANGSSDNAEGFDRRNPELKPSEQANGSPWLVKTAPPPLPLLSVDPEKESQRIIQIRKALETIVEPGQVVELRALNVSKVDYRRPHTQSGFFDFDHLDEMAEVAYRLTPDAQGVYFTLNPLKLDVLARRYNRVEIVTGDTARDVDVEKRARLLIDADPVRIAGVSAKETEKANAKDVIRRVQDFLQEGGWPNPIFADSGNGYHLLYDIDLPVDDDELVKRVLTALAVRFDTPEVKIDRQVFNPSRIVKLYGTLARKGDSIADRPHRWTSIIETPDDRKVVSRELLEALARTTQKGSERNPSSSIAAFSLNGNESAAGKAKHYLSKMPGAVSGQQGHNSTFTAANILIRGFGLSIPDALPIIKEWNAKCQPPWNEKDLLHKLEDAEKQDGARGYLLGNTGAGCIVVASGFKADFINSAAFDALAIEHEWLIKKIMVAKQPAVVGGPKKVLKTSLMIDLAVSLGGGKKFLNNFDVPRRLRVLVLSGESGKAAIQNTARRVCKAKGINLNQCDIFWGFRLPWLSSQNDLLALSSGIIENGIEVVIIDPLYLCLLAGNAALQASNVYQMGPLLLGVAQACLDAGATPILVHHTTKMSGQIARGEGHEPLELDNLAFAGVAEFARQWAIVSRREKYDPEAGDHKLWLNVGGSAGHSGLYGVDIREGILNDCFSGREWLVSVQTATNARDTAARAKSELKEKEKQARDGDDRAKVLRALEMYPEGETAKVNGQVAGIGNRATSVLLELLRGLQVVRTTIQKPCGRNPAMQYPGWRLWRPGEKPLMTTSQSEQLKKGELIETVLPVECQKDEETEVRKA